MASHPDEIEADFQQYYGIDLETAFEVHSPNHLSILAAQLPKDSRCIKAVTDFEWSEEMHMLANIEHELRTLIWIQCSGGKKQRPPVPKRIESPSEAKRVKRNLEATNFDELNKAFGLEG